ncbi:hypothetical protein [Kitasatospora sp. NPDC056531]|uniref:hypothetical protein n=1 Tax=Kitasatospora sp. NPDC056531 TaxID=3345856 RepID=UPI0036A80F87
MTRPLAKPLLSHRTAVETPVRDRQHQRAHVLCGTPTVTCTRSDVLNPGGTYPRITLRVLVSRTATGTVTNTATVSVSGGGNGTATITDPTAIDPRPGHWHHCDHDERPHCDHRT